MATPWEISDERTRRALANLKTNELWAYLHTKLEMHANDIVRTMAYPQSAGQRSSDWYAGRLALILELIDAATHESTENV